MARTTKDAPNNDYFVEPVIEGGESEYAGIIRTLGGEPFRFAPGEPGIELIQTPHWSEYPATPTDGEDD